MIAGVVQVWVQSSAKAHKQLAVFDCEKQASHTAADFLQI